MNLGGKVADITYGLDENSKGADAEKIYIHADKLERHYKKINQDDWEGREGEMYDYIASIVKKYGN